MPDTAAPDAPAPTAPAGDPFGGAAPAPEPTAPATPEPAAPAPEPTPDPAAGAEPEPDLSEQEQALLARFEGALDARGLKPEPEPGELSNADAVQQLLGREPAPEPQQQADPNADPNAVYEDNFGNYVDAAGNIVPPEMVVTVDAHGNEIPAGGPQQPQQPQGDPRLDQVISYIQAKEAEQNEQAVLDLVDQNPDMREKQMLSAVEAKAEQLAREAGNPALATSPTFVKAALALARSERATPSEVPADQARNQGATLPTDAGASVDGAPSPEDQWWNGVSGAGGQAFPS